MRFLELFAGAGGAHLGILRAGHQVLRAVEWNADAAATLRATGAEVYCGDVRHSDAYLGLPYVDAVWASPPCQDWSSAGKRAGAKGDRNGWPWTLDVIDFLRATGRGPTWAVFENVPGMLHHVADCRCPHGPPEDCSAGYFHRWIIPELRKRFAHVAYEVLDAANYGVPQHRNRVFIVCGPVEYMWPKATHAAPEVANGFFGRMMGLKPWWTVRKALGLPASTARIASGIGYSDPGTHGRPRHLDQPSPTVPVGSPMYLHDHPAPTVAAGNGGKGCGQWGDGRTVRAKWEAGTGVRRLTVQQSAVLQSFPPDYPWQGTQTSVYAQIGNSVPWPLAFAVASGIMGR